MSRRLPVTLIGGFLGAGKTSLLHHMISEHQGGYLAVLVENLGPLNLDAKAVRGLCGAMRRTNDAVFEIPGGDEVLQVAAITGTLRELAQAGRYERVLIEVAGTSSPAWLARQAEVFAEWAEVEQIVCVVDALDYFRAARGPVAMRASLEFQNEQMVGATLIVLNKCDLLEPKELDVCRAEVQRVHSQARILETAYGEVPAGIWSAPATEQEFASAVEVRETTNTFGVEPPLASALYRTHRPFHPGRFWDWFNAEHAGLLRVEGARLVGDGGICSWGRLAHALAECVRLGGYLVGRLPREEWPQDEDALARMQETWQEPYGDRRQELILIGEAAQISTTTRKELDACLLTDEEYARPVKEWATFPDPFPAWDLED